MKSKFDTGIWKRRKLGAEEISKINPSSGEKKDYFAYIDLENVSHGKLKNYQFFDKKDAPSRAQRILSDSDILFQLVRPYQKNNLLFHKECDFQVVASTGYAQIRSVISSVFLYYYMHTDEFVGKVLSLCTGSNYPAITSNSLSEIFICYPQKEIEQRHIAEILSTCDEVIEKTEAAIAKYRAIKAGMMQELFTRGLDANGKLRPRPEAAPGLYKDSELGLIPKEWEVEQFDICFELHRNNTFARALLSDQPGNVYNIHYGDVLIKYNDHLDCKTNNIPSLTENAEKMSGDDFIKEGDVIFADTAEDDTVGKVIEIINVGSLKIVSGLHTIFSHPIKPLFVSKWLGFFLNSDMFHAQMLPYVVGSKVSSISRENIKKTYVVYPSKKEQQNVVNSLTTLAKQISVEERTLQKYQSIKQGLMKKLLTPPEGALEA